jgi:hypothetical protein
LFRDQADSRPGLIQRADKYTVKSALRKAFFALARIGGPKPAIPRQVIEKNDFSRAALSSA